MSFKISLLDNAIDELDSIRSDLELYLDIAKCDDVSDKQKRYAIKRTIKQLICCWELLMKYRLQKQDWRNIFAYDDEATEANLQTGNFVSVSAESAIKRLKKYHICPDFTNLKKLRTYRNQIEHYQIDAPLNDILETIIASIDELTKFCTQFILGTIEQKASIHETCDILAELFGLRKTLSKLLSDGIFILS